MEELGLFLEQRVIIDLTLEKLIDCLEKQAHYSSINIQDKKEGEATFSKE